MADQVEISRSDDAVSQFCVKTGFGMHYATLFGHDDSINRLLHSECVRLCFHRRKRGSYCSQPAR